MPTDRIYRPLTPEEKAQLERQGCYCQEGVNFSVCDDTDLCLIRATRFAGSVKIGALSADGEREQGIYNAVIKDCVIGDHVYISGVTGRLEGLTIAEDVRIENVGRIIAEPEADFGVGTAVSVLDETGSRPVYIYPGLTSQVAAMMAYRPQWTEETFQPLVEELRDKQNRVPTIGRGAEVTDTRYILNVRIGEGVRVCGSSSLVNGSILSNAAYDHSLTFVGYDVDAQDFIVEDAHVDTGTLLRRCYVGQGAELEKRFTAHDSLFFANCSMENGEACAVFAGPYTVSMHKSSLLIGGEYSFFNAGSGTNSSNHMYKLGPVHWGVMQRGVKAASDAYMMWGGRVGAYSLLMGAHKSHADTSAFPFSYLFGRPDGSTLVMPGLMLKSCGLMRDELKWPKRDRRVKGRVPLHDNVCFEVLNPITVGTMIKALKIFDELGAEQADESGFVKYNNLLLRAKDMERSKELYLLAIAKYINIKLNEAAEVSDAVFDRETEWKDVGGQIVPDDVIERAMQVESLAEITEIFNEAFEHYAVSELAWVRIVADAGLMAAISGMEDAGERLAEFCEIDRKQSIRNLAAHNSRFSL